MENDFTYNSQTRISDVVWESKRNLKISRQFGGKKNVIKMLLNCSEQRE